MVAVYLLLVLVVALVTHSLPCTTVNAIEFADIDINAPNFNVDWHQSPAERFASLREFASVPLKGWNSYDGWDWCVTEADMVANIDYVAANLAALGYKIVTVDYYWYMDLNTRTIYLDEHGRLQPDPNRFPSSMGGQGFKALAAYAHSKGLLFGIHTMRGINVVASKQMLTVLGTNVTIDQITDTTAPCPWAPNSSPVASFYSINLNHTAGQTFSDSLYAQYADWGVDFIKNDCVFGNYVFDQIDSVSRAIDNSGRPMLYSLSPGTDDSSLAAQVQPYVSMYRITGDTWDRWSNIATHFLSAQRLQDYIAKPNSRYGLPSWPDLDMLPLGWIGIEGQNIAPMRWCNLTHDEQVTLMSLWTIFRSPLIYGGTFQRPDPFSLALITNTETLAVTDRSTNNTCLVNNATTAIWRADASDASGVSYFTVHNVADIPNTYTVELATVIRSSVTQRCSIRDLWARKDIASALTTFIVTLRPHASGLWKVFDCADVRSTAATY